MRARLDAVRARLLETTLDLVAEGGWAAASVAAVARGAGVATGTVYRHFAGRDALLAEPAGAPVEAERLDFRGRYRSVFAGLVTEGVARGEVGPCDPWVLSAVATGGLGEALVGPLAPAGSGDAARSSTRRSPRACAPSRKGTGDGR